MLQAIEVAKRVGMRLILAAAEDDYYREHVAPHVDGTQIVYFGEADFAAKVKLYGGARALLYPIQAREPFGLVLAEAMACGTPVAALDRGAVREVVDDGVTGIVFDDLEQMVDGLPRVFALDRRRVRERAVARFGVERMVDEYVAVYTRLVEAHRADDRVTRRHSPAAPCSPSSPIPTTSRWRAAARWPASPTPAPASSCSARRAASAGRSAIRRSCPTAISAASRARELREAAAVLGVAEVIVLRSSATATCAGTTCPSCTPRSSRPSERYRPDARDHLRRRRPLLAPRSHRRARAHATRPSSRSAPPRRRSTT